MSPALSLVSLAMSPVSLPRSDPAAKLRRKADEAVQGEDMTLRPVEARGHDGCEDLLGRFKRTPVTPTIPPSAGW